MATTIRTSTTGARKRTFESNHSFMDTWRGREHMSEKDELDIVVMGWLRHLEEFNLEMAEPGPCTRSDSTFLLRRATSSSSPNKRAVLCGVCRPATCAIRQSPCCTDHAGKALTQCPYVDIVSDLFAHFTMCPQVTVQRFAFHMCSQQPGNDSVDFVAALHRLS